MVQLGGILLYPWMETSPRGRAVLTAFGVLVLGVALRVVRRSPWLTWLALVLAVLVVLLSVISAVAPHPGLTIATAALEAAFCYVLYDAVFPRELQRRGRRAREGFAARYA